MTIHHDYLRSIASGELYHVIAGPAVVSDFVEMGNRFSYNEIRLGISSGWIVDGTVLERNGIRYRIEDGKKIRIGA